MVTRSEETSVRVLYSKFEKRPCIENEDEKWEGDCCFIDVQEGYMARRCFRAWTLRHWKLWPAGKREENVARLDVLTLCDYRSTDSDQVSF